MWLSKPLPTFKSQAVGTNDCFIPDGVKIHKIVLELGDANGLELAGGALVGNIELIAKGSTQRKCTAVQLNAINSLRGPKYALKTSGTPGTAGYRTYLTIFFASPWIHPRNVGNAFGWNLAPGTALQLRVTTPAGVTTPVIQGNYYYTALDGGFGAIEKWFPTQLPVNGASNEHTQIPNVKELLQSLHFFPQAGGGYVSEVTLKRGVGSTLIDQLSHLKNQASLLDNGWQPDTIPSPRFDLLFDEEDALDNGLPITGEEINVKTTYSTSLTGTMDVVAVVLGNPE